MNIAVLTNRALTLIALTVSLSFLVNSASANDGRVYYAGLTSAEYQNIFDSLTPYGYRVTWARGYSTGNATLFDVEMRKISGGSWLTYHGMSDCKFRERSMSFAQQGYQMTVHSAYRVNGTLLHLAVWERP